METILWPAAGVSHLIDQGGWQRVGYGPLPGGVARQQSLRRGEALCYGGRVVQSSTECRHGLPGLVYILARKPATQSEGVGVREVGSIITTSGI